MSEVSLREYFERLLREADLRYQQRFDAQQEALITAFTIAREALAEAKAALVVGFEKLNEWRASLNDVMATRMSRQEFDSLHSAIADKVDANSSRLDRMEARSAGVGASWRDVPSIIAVLISGATVILVLLHH